jgi:hypothetical protein
VYLEGALVCVSSGTPTALAVSSGFPEKISSIFFTPTLTSVLVFEAPEISTRLCQ